MKNNDIAQLLYRIKENIQAVEAGVLNDLILQEIQSDYLKLLELIKLFLISERDSYYGYFLMNMQFQVDFHSRSSDQFIGYQTEDALVETLML